jgi:hypothetical protein
MMRLAHLHLARRDDPERTVQINLAPLAMAQLAGADGRLERVKGIEPSS